MNHAIRFPFLICLLCALIGTGCRSVDGLMATAPLREPLHPGDLEAALAEVPGLGEIRRIESYAGPGQPPFPEYLILTRKASFWLLAGHGGRLVYLTYDADHPMPDGDFHLFLHEAERVHRHLQSRLPQLANWESAKVESVKFSRAKMAKDETAERRSRTD